jgi:hypothetical protein
LLFLCYAWYFFTKQIQIVNVIFQIGILLPKIAAIGKRNFCRAAVVIKIKEEIFAGLSDLSPSIHKFEGEYTHSGLSAE